MSGVWVTCRREWRLLIQWPSSGVVSLVSALVGSAALFVWLLQRNGVGELPLQAVWGFSLALCLPILAVLLSVRLFAEDRASGMLELFFSSPISEGYLVLGKFLAVWLAMVLFILVTALSPLIFLPQMMAGSGVPRVSFFELTSVMCVLILQAGVWCSISVFLSLFFKQIAATGTLMLFVCCGLPLASIGVMRLWFPTARSLLGWISPLSHIYDVSTGLLALFPVVFDVSVIVVMLWLAVIRLSNLRLSGR